LLALRYDRHVTHAELEQALAPTGIIQHVDASNSMPFARKKLFRP
jgi:hypothetical protein